MSAICRRVFLVDGWVFVVDLTSFPMSIFAPCLLMVTFCDWPAHFIILHVYNFSQIHNYAFLHDRHFQDNMLKIDNNTEVSSCLVFIITLAGTTTDNTVV